MAGKSNRNKIDMGLAKNGTKIYSASSYTINHKPSDILEKY